MKQHTKDDLGGAAFVIGLSTLFWLAFVIILSGCSPALPNAPNAQPTRVAKPASHDKDPEFFPGEMQCMTVLPPSGQYFDTTATDIRATLQWSSPNDGYKWMGYTCARFGGYRIGAASGYYPERGSGVIVAQLTPDSITVWGAISTYVPAKLDFYEVEVRVGTLLARNDVRPVLRLSPITCRGKLIYCTIVGECAMDPGEQAGGELEEAEYWPAQPRRVMP